MFNIVKAAGYYGQQSLELQKQSGISYMWVPMWGYGAITQKHRCIWLQLGGTPWL